jgi:hypothetical protein
MFQERDKIEKIMGEAVGRMINDRRRTPISVLRVAGAEIVALVTEKIARSRGWAKRNHDSTVAKKGFNYPLHETGKLKKAVSWAIRSGSAIGPILVQGKS